MVSKRVYKDAHSPFEVLDEFSQGRFSDLDMELVNAFLNMPIELLDKFVLLSDGSIGRIIYITLIILCIPLLRLKEKSSLQMKG